jgi:hypothetical protein
VHGCAWFLHFLFSLGGVPEVATILIICTTRMVLLTSDGVQGLGHSPYVQNVADHFRRPCQVGPSQCWIPVTFSGPNGTIVSVDQLPSGHLHKLHKHQQKFSPLNGSLISKLLLRIVERRRKGRQSAAITLAIMTVSTMLGRQRGPGLAN